MIECKSLSRRYDQTLVFSDLSFIVEEGITCIRGENGSGKSTLLRLIANVEPANSGQILFCGKPNDSRFYALSADSVQPPTIFTPNEVVKLISKHRDFDSARFSQLIEQFQMMSFLDVEMSQLSTGTIKKISILNAICTASKVLIIDEPFNGIDQQSVEPIKTLIEQDERIKLVVDHLNLIEPHHVVNL